MCVCLSWRRSLSSLLSLFTLHIYLLQCRAWTPAWLQNLIKARDFTVQNMLSSRTLCSVPALWTADEILSDCAALSKSFQRFWSCCGDELFGGCLRVHLDERHAVPVCHAVLVNHSIMPPRSFSNATGLRLAEQLTCSNLRLPRWTGAREAYFKWISRFFVQSGATEKSIVQFRHAGGGIFDTGLYCVMVYKNAEWMFPDFINHHSAEALSPYAFWSGCSAPAVCRWWTEFCRKEVKCASAGLKAYGH